MLGQTLPNLTLTKPRIQGKKGQREYEFQLMKKIALYSAVIAFSRHVIDNFFAMAATSAIAR
jgi:hypothetical protein